VSPESEDGREGGRRLRRRGGLLAQYMHARQAIPHHLEMPQLDPIRILIALGHHYNLCHLLQVLYRRELPENGQQVSRGPITATKARAHAHSNTTV
jgi:hypothetical protein